MNHEHSLLAVRCAPAFLFMAMVCATGQLAAGEVTLAWDPNSEPDLAGYRLYYSTGEDVEPVVLDVGNVTTRNVTGLEEGVTYWFVATAYDTSDLESDPSNEVSYTVPSLPSNATPTISAVANRTIAEDGVMGPVSFTVGDVDDDVATLTVTASSSNTALVPQASLALGGSGANRTVTATPTANANGSTTITLTVSDGQATATRSFTLTVTAVNDQPTIGTVANQSVAEDMVMGPLTFTVSDVDNSASALTVAASSSNTALVPQTGLALGGSGGSRTLTATPTANAFGTTTITLTVGDGSATATRTFTLTVTAVNDTPTIGTVANQTIAQGTVMGPVAFTVGDVDNDPATLTVTASSSNTALVPQTGLVLGGSGSNRTIRATPSANGTGTATITLTVNDGQRTASRSFMLTVTASNDAPTISAVANQTVTEDAVMGPLGFTVNDADDDPATLTVTASSSNTALVPQSGLALGGSGSNRTVRAAPSANASGTTTITLSVSDGQNTATRAFTLTVTAVNDPPTVGTVANRTITEDAVMGPVAFTVGDVDNDPATLTVTASSGNTTLLPQTGLTLGGSGSNRTITATPTANAIGTTTITLTVSDGQTTASRSFTLTVTTVNDVPTISAVADQTIAEDATMGPLAFTVGDVENDPATLTVTASSSNTALVPQTGLTLGGSGASRTLTARPASNANGSTTITLTASDGQRTGTRSFTLTVSAVNDPPTISSINDQATAEDMPAGPIAFTLGDVDNDPATLTITASSSNPTLVPPTGLVLEGTGSDRTITIIPALRLTGTATITITVSDGAASATGSFTLLVEESLPAPWTAQDIGNPALAGHVAWENSVFTVTGTGADIAGTADEFHFIWQPLSGDGQITARISAFQAPNGLSKAGVMIRETLEANSKNAFLCVTPDNGFRFQLRSSTGMSTSSSSGGALYAAPNNWVRLVRQGNWLRAYRSQDGKSWTRIGNFFRLSMASQIHIGLAVTSRSEIETCTATVDKVTVVP